MAPRIVADAWYRSDDAELRAIAPAGTLRNWRSAGAGPPFYKLSRGKAGRVAYYGADLLAWLETRRVERKTA